MAEIPILEERVLPTLNPDGSRRKLRPKLNTGRFYWWRFGVAWGLIALFVGLPFISVGGHPAVLLDLPSRKFHFFGLTLLPTDAVILLLFGLTAGLVVFLVTALAGRVWCGWGCPQTVYMEYVYRPLERLIEGGRSGQLKLDKDGGGGRRILKLAVFAVVSFVLANVFLAYFVGTERLSKWVLGSPFDHPGGFAVVMATAALVFFDFAYFREQMCTIACPYARLQAVLLDRKSLIIGYDELRGEPRGPLRKSDAASAPKGDCIACNACVVTCPTGIDIREGLQLECIGCAQCIDACDHIMDKIGKPRGLIRYSSQDTLAGKPSRVLRPRVLGYPLLIVILGGLLGVMLAGRDVASVRVLRGQGAPFVVQEDGWIQNPIILKVTNRTSEARQFTIDLVEPKGAQLIVPLNPIAVGGDATETQTVFISVPPETIAAGSLGATFHISDGQGFEDTHSTTLLGPTGPGAGRGTAAP
jgi:cytochrome c oxidase accessory protein FixG